MNQVILKLVLTRDNSKQVRMEFFREGAGDDLVDSRADELEAVVRGHCDLMVSRDGGEYTKG